MFDLELLDKILSLLNKDSKGLTTREIFTVFGQDILYKNYITSFMVEKSLERLLNDNYIKEVNSNSTVKGFEDSIITHYVLTSHGFTFISDSGYVKRYQNTISLNEQNEQLRASQIELNTSTLSSNRRMARLTLVIAIGTGVAAFYYIVEIVRAIFSYYNP